jgi:hypothetical protein
MSDFVKSPCKSCPFRNDVKPYLHPERAAEIVYAASNPYSDFPCHSTFEYDGDEDIQGRPTGDFSRAKTCAGFLTLRAQGGEDVPEGFEPSWEICYIDDYDMIQAYEEEWENKNANTQKTI